MPAGLLVAQQDVPGADRIGCAVVPRELVGRCAEEPRNEPALEEPGRGGRSSRSRSPPPACRREPRPRRWPPARCPCRGRRSRRSRCRSAARSSAGGYQRFEPVRSPPMTSGAPGGIRTPTPWSEATCSGPLSYGRPPPEGKPPGGGPPGGCGSRRVSRSSFALGAGQGAARWPAACRVPAGRGVRSPGGQHTGVSPPRVIPEPPEAFGPKSRCEPIDPGSRGHVAPAAGTTVR